MGFRYVVQVFFVGLRGGPGRRQLVLGICRATELGGVLYPCDQLQGAGMFQVRQVWGGSKVFLWVQYGGNFYTLYLRRTTHHVEGRGQSPGLIHFFVVISRQVNARKGRSQSAHPSSYHRHAMRCTPNGNGSSIQLFFFRGATRVPSATRRLTSPTTIFIFFHRSSVGSTSFLVRYGFIHSMPFYHGSGLVTLLYGAIHRVARRTLDPTLLRTIWVGYGFLRQGISPIFLVGRGPTLRSSRFIDTPMICRVLRDPTVYEVLSQCTLSSG